jgi:hypothetical protein
MSLGSAVAGCCLVLVACMGLAACGSDGRDADEPQTAREKMRREAKRDKKKDKPVDSTGKSWSKWRYTGDRAECYFRLGQKCFKTEAAACAQARCKKPTKCHAEGAAPAQISCKK